MKGKSLNNEPEAENETIKTIEAIGLLYGLESLFVRKSVTHPVTIRGVEYQKEISREYYSEENINELFSRRFNEEKAKSRMLSMDTFAKGEIERINAKLNMIRNTNADVAYFTTHDGWKSAVYYIEYLEMKKYCEKRIEVRGLSSIGEDEGIDLEKLHKELQKYLEINVKSLKELIKHNSIPNDEHATWIGPNADAARFALWLNPNNKHYKSIFNKNIKLKNGGTLKAGHEKGMQPEKQGSIWDILGRYKK